MIKYDKHDDGYMLRINSTFLSLTKQDVRDLMVAATSAISSKREGRCGVWYIRDSGKTVYLRGHLYETNLTSQQYTDLLEAGMRL